MSDIVAERAGNILSIQLNRRAKKNARNYSTERQKMIRYASCFGMLREIRLVRAMISRTL